MRRAIVIGLVVLAGLAELTLAGPPTLDGRYAAALHRRLAKHPEAQRLLVPATCTRTRPNTYACVKRGCAGSCQVIEARATVELGKAGALSVRGVAVKRLGDTGECGDCMHVE